MHKDVVVLTSTPKDFLDIKVQDSQKELYDMFINKDTIDATYRNLMSHAVRKDNGDILVKTVFDEESLEIIAIVMVVQMSSHIAECMTYLTDGFRKYHKYFSEQFKEHLEGIPHARIQAYADPKHPRHGRYLTFLGFEKEGRLHNYVAEGIDVEIYYYKGSK